jgi:hypothetical protein
MLNSGKLIEKRAQKKAAQVRDIIRATLDRRIEELITSSSDVMDERSGQHSLGRYSLDPYSLAEDIIKRMGLSIK